MLSSVILLILLKADYQPEAADPQRSDVRNGCSFPVPGDCGLLRGEPGRHEAGGNRIRDGADYRPDCQRGPACPRVHDEQAGGGRRNHEEPVSCDPQGRTRLR